jgi:hypothetical protein
MLTIAGEGQMPSARGFPAEGIPLAPGDIVMTGRGSYAELQVFPKPEENAEPSLDPRPIIKLIENTTLRYLSFADNTATVELLYGQMRVVSPVAPDREDGISLAVKTGNMQTNISGGDFNVDYMIHPEESLIERGRNGTMRLQVYSFGSETEIVQTGNSAGPGFIVSKYEKVAIEMGNARSVIERKPLDAEIVSFWENMPFMGTPPRPAPDFTLPLRGSRFVVNEKNEGSYVIFPVIDAESAALANIRWNDSPDGGEPLSLPGERTKLKVKNGFLISGMILSALGLGTLAYGQYGANLDLPSTDVVAGYSDVALGVGGLGVISLIVSFFVNPAIP